MRAWTLPLVLFVACDETTPTFTQCELDLVVSDVPVEPGDLLVVGGTPHSDRVDTVAFIGDVRAEIESVVRSECSLCDACRVSECEGLCVDCRACEATCDPCVEELTLVIPELASGPTDLVVTNRFGISPPLPVNVTVPEDTDTDVDTDSDTDSDTDTTAN